MLPCGLRNLLFVVVCLAGAGLVANSLLRRERIEQPKSLSRHDSANRRDSDWATTLDKLNAEFRQHWQAQGLDAAPRADDLTIARRLSLALVGTVPSLEEIRALEAVPAAETRSTGGPAICWRTAGSPIIGPSGWRGSMWATSRAIRRLSPPPLCALAGRPASREHALRRNRARAACRRRHLDRQAGDEFHYGDGEPGSDRISPIRSAWPAARRGLSSACGSTACSATTTSSATSTSARRTTFTAARRPTFMSWPRSLARPKSALVGVHGRREAVQDQIS